MGFSKDKKTSSKNKEKDKKTSSKDKEKDKKTSSKDKDKDRKTSLKDKDKDKKTSLKDKNNKNSESGNENNNNKGGKRNNTSSEDIQTTKSRRARDRLMGEDSSEEEDENDNDNNNRKKKNNNKDKGMEESKSDYLNNNDYSKRKKKHIDDDERLQCINGLRKMKERNLQWLIYCRRHRLLSLEGLSSSEQPMRHDIPYGYFCYIHKVDAFHIPPGLRAQVRDNGNLLRFSVSVSFYHTVSQRFFGSTFMGNSISEHGEKIDKKRKKKSKHTRRREQHESEKRNGDSHTNNNNNNNNTMLDPTVTISPEDVIYWYSFLNDPNCVLILEVVVTEFDPYHNIEQAQYGCGWSMISPFNSNVIRDYGDSDDDVKLSFQDTPLYTGSPRQLLFYTMEDWKNIPKLAMTGTLIQYQLFRYYKFLKCQHLLNENEIISAKCRLPGLDSMTVKINNKNQKFPCIGYGEVKRKSDIKFMPVKPRLSPVYSVKLSRMRITIPDRYGYEKLMKSNLMKNLPQQIAVQSKKGFFGDSNKTIEAQQSDRRISILGRFLKVIVHNGRRQIGKALDIILKEDRGEDDDLINTHDTEVLRDVYTKSKIGSIFVMLYYQLRVGDKDSSADFSHKLHVNLGIQGWIPFDGKRIRLRNQYVKATHGLKLILEPSDKCRLLSNDLLFTATRGKTKEPWEEIGVRLNLELMDSEDYLNDETPLNDMLESDGETTFDSADESKLGEGKHSSDIDSSEPEDDMEDDSIDSYDSAKSDSESSYSSNSDSSSSASSIVKKHHKKHKNNKRDLQKLARSKRKKSRRISTASVVSDLTPSLVSGNSIASNLRETERTRIFSPPNPFQRSSPMSDFSDWDGWKTGVHVPHDKSSILAHALQSKLNPKGNLGGTGNMMGTSGPLQSPFHTTGNFAGNTTMMRTSNIPNQTMQFTRNAATLGAHSAPLSQELSRATKTRLSKMGFGDVMKDSINASNTINGPPIIQGAMTAQDIDAEVLDELSRHEITIQFAAFRLPAGRDVGVPSNFHFTYQFYNCKETKTDSMFVREERSAGKENKTNLFVLTKGTKYGRDAPSNAYRYIVDTTMMQPGEARKFAEYLAYKTLYVDVWDSDGLLYFGTFAIPLWRLMRQGNPVSKLAYEYECVAQDGLADENASIPIGPGMVGSGSVMGYFQVLICNYGEKGQGSNDMIDNGIQTIRGESSLGTDWRMGSTNFGTTTTKGGGHTIDVGNYTTFVGENRPLSGRPSHKVRARPLSDTNNELADVLEKTIGSSPSRLSRTAPAMTKANGMSSSMSGRQSAGMDTISIDELQFLVRRFRSGIQGRISYDDKLLQLLDVEKMKSIEKRFTDCIQAAEERGIKANDILGSKVHDVDGFIRIPEFEDALERMGAFRDLQPQEARSIVKRFEQKDGYSGKGKIDVHKFFSFLNARKPGADLDNKFKRLFQKAIYKNVDFKEIFKEQKKGKMNLDGFQKAIAQLPSKNSIPVDQIELFYGKLIKEDDVMLELDTLFRHLEIEEADFHVEAPLSLEQRLQKIIIRSEMKFGASISDVFSMFDPTGCGEFNVDEFIEGLKSLEDLDEYTDEDAKNIFNRWDLNTNGKVDITEFYKWMGKTPKSPEEIIEEKIVLLLMKGREHNMSIDDVYDKLFDTNQDGILSEDEYLSNLNEIEVFKNMSEEESKSLFKRLDSDEKGFIRKDNFKTFAEQALKNYLQQKHDRKLNLCLEKLRECFELHSEHRDVVKQLFGPQDKPRQEELLKTIFIDACRKYVPTESLDEDELDDVMSHFESEKIKEKIDLVKFLGWFYSDKNLSPKASKRKASKEMMDESAQSKGQSQNKERGGKDDYDDSNADAKGGTGKDSKDAKENDSKDKNLDSSDEEDDFTSQESYEFSKHFETKLAERKLRKIAIKEIRKGVDIEALFQQFDSNKTGSITRADFVQVLMYLGLSLLDSDPKDDDMSPFCGNSTQQNFSGDIRKKQMLQMTTLRSRANLTNTRNKFSSTFLHASEGKDSGDDNKESLSEASDTLALIKWFREGQKKQAIKDMLIQSIRKKCKIYPRFGETQFFEVPFENPFNHEERFLIRITGDNGNNTNAAELRVVYNSEEWYHLRQFVPVAFGEIGTDSVENDMVDVDPNEGIQLTLAPNEKVSIPFVYLSLTPFEENSASSKLEIMFLSAMHGTATSILTLEIEPRPFIVDRRFNFYQGEGEILKRFIRLCPKQASYTGAGSTVNQNPLEVMDSTKYIHCVQKGKKRSVVVEWRDNEGTGNQEILIKYLCGSFPSDGEFYILIYNDHFQATLYELWSIKVESRLRIDVSTCMGQTINAELVVRGDRFARRVKCLSSVGSDTIIQPEGAFKLVPGAYNTLIMKYKPRTVENKKLYVNLVDLDSRELIMGWIVNSSANPPSISKAYDVDIPVGETSNKKIVYINPWNKPRKYKLVSSNDTILKPRQEILEISAKGQGYIRLWFAPSHQVGNISEVFLFLNDENDQNEETFLVKTRTVFK